MINALGGSKKDNVVKEVRKEEIGKGWKRRKEIREIYPENMTQICFCKTVQPSISEQQYKTKPK